MFKVGSKLLLGTTGFAAVSLVVYLVFVDRLAIGGVALSMLLVALVGVSIAVLMINEGDDEPQPRDTALTRASMWPLLAALGLGLLVLGLVVSQLYFIAGGIVLVVALAEWMVQAWSETASDDPAHNEFARQRLLHPIEFPVVATLGLGVMIFSFSRIMLAISKNAGTVTFIVLAAVVLAAGSMFAMRPALKPALVSGICVIGAVGIVAGGIAGTGAGVRSPLAEAAAEDHFSHRECGPEKAKYFDDKAMKTLSLRTNAVAIIELHDGQLTAAVDGFNGSQQQVSVPRANPVTFIFRNFDAAERRMVASLGNVADATPADGVVDVEHGDKNETCTQLVAQGAEQALTITYNKPSRLQNEPFTLTVAGIAGQGIEVVVP